MNYKQIVFIFGLSLAHSAQPTIVMHAPERLQGSLALYQRTKAELLKNPAAVLAKNNNDSVKAVKTVGDAMGLLPEQYQAAFIDPARSDELIKNLSAHRRVLENENPIWLISECSDDGCPLSRSTTPHYRQNHEEEIANAIIEKAKQKAQVNYLNFASGLCGSLQDLIVVTKALEHGVQKINIHLIDSTMRPFIDFITLYSNGITHAHAPIVFEKIDSAHNNLQAGIHKKSELEALFKETDTKAQLAEYLHRVHQGLSQLSSWFKILFPAKQVDIYMHENFEDYKAFTITHPELIADVCTATDFDENALLGNAHLQFREILKHSFALNKNAIGYHLVKPTELLQILWSEDPAIIERNEKRFPFIDPYIEIYTSAQPNNLDKGWLFDPTFTTSLKPIPRFSLNRNTLIGLGIGAAGLAASASSSVSQPSAFALSTADAIYPEPFDDAQDWPRRGSGQASASASSSVSFAASTEVTASSASCSASFSSASASALSAIYSAPSSSSGIARKHATAPQSSQPVATPQAHVHAPIGRAAQITNNAATLGVCTALIYSLNKIFNHH